MGSVEKKPVIGFIGIGVMGSSMASNLMDKGYDLIVYTRTKEKAEELLDKGAEWSESPRLLAQSADVIISIVGYPKDVEEIYLGEEGAFQSARKGTIVIDMTTSKPSLAKKLYAEGKKKGISVLDAPVSGGDIGAEKGTLAIMVGGEKEVYEKALPILQAMGTNIVYQGEAGAGQHTKMCNQIVIASNMVGVCEAIVYAEKAGLNPQKVLDSISTGAAASWSLSNLAPRILNEDYSPGFFVKHFIKDMQIALEEAAEMDMKVPGLTLSKSMYETIAKKGEGDSGTQALRKFWD
ncbi:NAD(P)-dependent oxidoreductase [Bacillus testis]|uniref:NAD(P)-dependent oxidoreductase n=1 Tax=Bacillus testis TaxID=1622072 RepID=UPI00067EF86B|nr:NAD(P)-dependent oxidoreductase [Bacillus testis]